MVYGYIRVSTDRQTVENQRFEIKRFCEGNDLQVGKWISETTSGTKEVDKRRLGKLLKGVKEGDIIICSEISRLGRSLFMNYTSNNVHSTQEGYDRAAEILAQNVY